MCLAVAGALCLVLSGFESRSFALIPALLALASALFSAFAHIWLRKATELDPPERVVFHFAALVASGSAMILVAGSVSLLTVGQALAGAASSIVMAAGVAAAAAWSDPGPRGRVVAWTLVGAPTAWVVTMPVIGVVAHADWHLAVANTGRAGVSAPGAPRA